MTQTAAAALNPTDPRSAAVDDIIIFSVKVYQGADKSPSFDSELRLPLPKTAEEQQRAVERWLDMMSSGLRINASEINATLESN